MQLSANDHSRKKGCLMLEAIVKPPISPKAKAASQAAQLANHTTALIRNCWYVAALS